MISHSRILVVFIHIILNSKVLQNFFFVNQKIENKTWSWSVLRFIGFKVRTNDSIDQFVIPADAQSQRKHWMMESVILDHQKTAEVRGMLLSSVLTMLPVLTYGALQSYLTIGLPQLLEENQTGILLDINKLSWISMILEFV